METKSIPIEKPRSELPIEQQANFEGSWTNLMIERLRNPEIQRQIVDLLFEEQEAGINQSKETLSWLKELAISDGRDPSDLIGKEKKLELEKKTRKDFEMELDKKLETISQNTPVSFDAGVEPHCNPNGREMMPVGFVDPKTGVRATERTMNICESHEKGHALRGYRSKFLIEKFWKVLDFNQIKFSNQELNSGFNTTLLLYFRNPIEVVERMSQLKNYFGINGNEKFTKEHLSYAREHYVKDTGFDNNMTKFFQAITPETEDAFIELINSAGI